MPSAAERDMLTDAQDAHLGELEAAVKKLGSAEPDVASLTATEQALNALGTAYDDSLKSLATMLRLPLVVDAPANVGSPPPWVALEAWHHRFANTLQLLLSETSVEVELHRVGDQAYMARTTYDDAPFFARFALRIPRGFQFATELYALDVMPVGTSLEVILRTSAPEATPRIFLQHAALLDRAKLLVGLMHEAKTNDQAFDDAFLVDAPEPLAQFLFTPKIRAALLGVPEGSLLLQHGYVEVRGIVSHMPTSTELRKWVGLLLDLRDRFTAMRADVRKRRGGHGE
jgi:hypothetical protein